MDDEIKLNWADAEEDGHVLVNFPARKLAVFANTMGCVALVLEQDGQQTVTELEPQEALDFVAMLCAAINEAVPTYQRNVAEFAAFEAISKAKGEGSE